MVRFCALAVVVAGAALVTGAAGPPRPADRPAEVRTVVVGQRVGFFSMPRVMRDYRRAKARVEGLTADRARLSANLVGLRAMYRDLHDRAAAGRGGPVRPAGADPVGADALTLTRLIEDDDREVTKVLDGRAAAIIAELHDELHAAAADLARERGLSAVLAFPDAASPEEADGSAAKELRLKPPAAYPFYLDPAADHTDELVRRVNAKFPPAD